MRLYQILSRHLKSWSHFKEKNSQLAIKILEDIINYAIIDHFPDDDDLDKTYLDYEKSTPNKLIFHNKFGLTKNRSNVEWRPFKVIVTPSLGYEFEVKIVGKLPERIKDELMERYVRALATDVSSS